MGKWIKPHISIEILKHLNILYLPETEIAIILQALGCLLFRICYFKNAFDGESKLQILNGNYRIPEVPKYCSPVTDLIRDMLQASPEDRPDITQASALLDWQFISMNLG